MELYWVTVRVCGWGGGGGAVIGAGYWTLIQGFLLRQGVGGLVLNMHGWA
jgi:hypothetical protein